MFYKVDSTRFTWREYFWSVPLRQWPLLPIAFLLKLLRIRLPIQTPIPDAIEPYVVERTELPGDV
jgi:hypothetical protein